jgi:hypothetical protein
MKLLGISERRFVVYCRSGSTKLIDSESTNRRLNLVDVTLEGDDTVQFRDASDRATDVSNVSGEIRISAKTPKAARVVEELRARIGR